MRVAAVKLIQENLKNLGVYTGNLDGDRGPVTTEAIQTALTQRNAAELPEGWDDYSSKRKAVAYLQLLAHDQNIDAGPIDGWWGPQTEFAFHTLHHLHEHSQLPVPWRDRFPAPVSNNQWPVETETDLTAFYGPHGEPDGSFEPPLVKVECPWLLRLAWNLNQSTRTIRIHERCASSLKTVLENLHREYGEAKIRELSLDHYGGSYMARLKRGGTSWSTHSWGIAIDWDPLHNRLHWNREQARLARPEYDLWWQIWEDQGWVSLGRSRNFDFMHVQAARMP